MSRRWLGGRWVDIGVAALLALLALTVMPAPALLAQGPGPGEVETDPIRCWWKTDRPSIRVGERFDLTLTCAAIETSRVTVVPTLSQLDPGALQITPFEVVGGSRRDDVLSAPWRYVQYDYTVRLIGEGHFGQDAMIPPLSVTYTIRSASGGGAEGRDLAYVLPALPLRVVSLVPRDAGDIRDASSENFAAVESRRFRARMAFVVATVLFAAAGVLVIVAATRAWGRARTQPSRALRMLSPARVLGGCLRSLAGLRADVSKDGWTPDLARRASTTLRVAAAVAAARPIAQAPAGRADTVHDGQLLIRRGWLRPTRMLLSAAMTPQSIDRVLGNGSLPSASAAATLTHLRGALEGLGAVGYGRGGDVDSATLDRALDEGAAAVQRLRRGAFIPARVARLIAGVRRQD